MLKRLAQTDTENDANISIETRMSGSEWYIVNLKAVPNFSKVVWYAPYIDQKATRYFYHFYLRQSVTSNESLEWIRLWPPLQYALSWRHFALSYAQCSCCPVTVTCVVDVVNRRRDGWYWIHILADAKDYFLLQKAHTGSGVQQASNSMTNGTLPGKKHPWRQADHLICCRG